VLMLNLVITSQKILYKCLKPCLPWTDQPDSTVPLLPQASNLQFIRGDSAGGMSAAACGLRPMNLSSTAASNFDTKLKPVYTDNAININSNQENNGSQLRMSDESLERASNILLASINARRSRRAVVMDPSPST